MAAARTQVEGPVTSELNRCQIEIGSAVCRTTDELRAELTRLRSQLGRAGESVGCALVAAGTHPTSSWEDQEVNTDSVRFVRMEERYQAIARQQIICGCHVHVGIDDPDLAIEIMNRSRPWLPVLLALSANSPYWHGVDTGYASYRTEVWHRWPTSGMPPTIRDRAAYDAFIDELASIGAIEDATHLYWYARPSARYPTVEFRSCDVCTDVDDTVAIAALTRALAWQCGREAEEGTDPGRRSVEALNAAVWRAARYGFGGRLVDARLDRTVDGRQAIVDLLSHLGDGLDAHGDRSMVERQVATILDRGNGASRQLAVAASAGDVDSVVGDLALRTVDVALPDVSAGRG